jgi:hypothetical protein
MRHAAAVVLFLTFPLSGCDLLRRLDEERVLAGVVIESPGVSSVTPPVTVGGIVVARAFFGEVEAGNSATSASGLAGAAVDVLFTPPGGAQVVVRLPGSGPAGQYGATSVETALAYHPGVEYQFRVVHDGETFTARVIAPDAATMESPRGTPVPTVQTAAHAAWPATWTISRQGTDLAVYAVDGVTGTGAIDFAGGGMNCTNAPGSDPKAWISLLLNDDPYRAESFALQKAACFPAAGTYAVGLTTLVRDTGSGVSSNLFLGSGALAGTSDAVAVVLQ